MQTLEQIARIAPIGTCLAAFVTALIALRALGNWKRQIVVQVNQAIARRILLDLYKLREEVVRLRVESEHRYDSLNGKALEDVLQDKLAGVQSAMSSLRIETSEAETAWYGTVLASQRSALLRHIGRLQSSICEFARQQHNGTATKDYERLKRIVFSHRLTDGEDRYHDELESIIESYESALSEALKGSMRRLTREEMENEIKKLVKELDAQTRNGAA